LSCPGEDPLQRYPYNLFCLEDYALLSKRNDRSV
jgi:hypothetical protein